MLRILFASVVLLAAAAPALRAEAVVSSRAVCAGVVVDGTGAVIRNAIVIYRAGSDRREERTDAEGRFTFAPAATGATVTATADGFEAVTLDAIGETRIVLAPLGVTERVDVSANLPGRRTSSATLWPPLRPMRLMWPLPYFLTTARPPFLPMLLRDFLMMRLSR